MSAYDPDDHRVGATFWNHMAAPRPKPVSDLRSRAADLLAALRVYPKDGRLVLDAMEALDAALHATDVPSEPFDIELLTDALLNEADRAAIEGPSYPKGWRGRAERLVAEYERLAAIHATDVPS